jgi:tetratricopeptide (TPR) repeat protein
MTDNHLLLYRLAELMLEHEQHILPVDILFDDEQIGDFVKSIQIDSPYQQMLLEGVLTESVRDEKLFVGFTVEGYFHYVLGEVIWLNSNQYSEPHNYFLKLINSNQINGIVNAIEYSLIRVVERGDENCLVSLINDINTHKDLFYINACISIIIRKKPQYFLNILFITNSAKNYECLFQILIKLEKNAKFDFLILFSKEIVFRFKNEDGPPELIKLLITCIYYLNPIDLEDFNLILDKLKSVQFKKKNYYLFYEISFYLIKLNLFKDALFFLKVIKNIEKKAHNLIGICYHGLKKYKLALRYFSFYNEYATLLNNQQAVAESKYNLSTCLYEQKKYDQAIILNQEAIEIEKKILGKYNSSFLISLFSLALNLRISGRFDQADDLLNQSLLIANKTLNQNNSIYLDIYLALGSNYSDLNNNELSVLNYEMAKKYSNKPLTYLRDPDYFLQEQYLLLGEKEFKKTKYLEAIKYFNKSISIYENYTIENKFTPPYFELAECHRILGNPQQSIAAYTKAIQISQNIYEQYSYNPKFWIGLELYELGQQYLNENNKNKAIDCFRKSNAYLILWNRNIYDPEWRNYVKSLIKYISSFLT